VTPVNQPLITSAYDIAESGDIQLFVRKAGTPDTIISASSFFLSTDRSVDLDLSFHLKFAGQKQYRPQPETTREAQL
jgi:hypothetical protein